MLHSFKHISGEKPQQILNVILHCFLSNDPANGYLIIVHVLLERLLCDPDWSAAGPVPPPMWTSQPLVVLRDLFCRSVSAVPAVSACSCETELW